MRKMIFLAMLALAPLSVQATPISGLSNTSFESNNISTSYSGFLYADVIQYLGPNAVSAAGWNFSGGAGISRDGTAWGGITNNGDYFGFLQNSASIGQSFYVNSASDIDFSFDATQRSNHGAVGGQTMSLFLDGIQIASYQPVAASWSSYSATITNVAAGNHLLEFRGTNNFHYYDTTAFIDNISMVEREPIASAEVPEPASIALVGLALLGLAKRRRR